MSNKPSIGTKSYSKSYVIRTVLNGFMIILPILIMIGIVTFLVRMILKFIIPFGQVLSLGSTNNLWIFHLLALIIVIGFFFFVGSFVNTSHGKRFFDYSEQKILKPIPFYSTISNIVEQFRGAGDRPFHDVVLIDPYKSGALMTGFIVERINENMVVVYVPTAPNPTNGFVFHMPENELIYTGAKTEDAMASVIGMGAGSKKLFKQAIDEYEQDINEDANANLKPEDFSG